VSINGLESPGEAWNPQRIQVRIADNLAETRSRYLWNGITQIVAV
jgi:hypothetical protein